MEKHRGHAKAGKADRMQRLEEAGLCRNCGVRPADWKLNSRCEQCQGYLKDYLSVRKEDRKEAGLCQGCGKVPPRKGKTRCQTCAEAVAEDERQRDKARTDRLKAEGLCIECGKEPAVEWQMCTTCKPKRQQAVKKSNLKLREQALQAYGGYFCACCKCEYHPQFLQLDHINNDGAAQRRELKITGGTAFYKYLRDNNYPGGIQVLCANCNAAKGFYGECPHQKQPELLRTPTGILSLF
jgi:hypothetical protein